MAMRHKNIYLMGAIVVVLGGTTAATVAIKHHHSTSLRSAEAVVQTAPHQLSYKGVSGKNALELLKMHAHITTKSTSFGPLVESINGVQGGGKYWMLYVNGKQAAVGAAAYVTKSADTIEWKFE